MCGRYTLFIDEEYQDIRKIIRAVQEKGHEVKTGEIYPTNPAPILVWEERGVVPQAVKWGCILIYKTLFLAKQLLKMSGSLIGQ